MFFRAFYLCFAASFFSALLLGCSHLAPTDHHIITPQADLPPPNTQVNIPRLGPCNNGSDRTLAFDNTKPLTILVHGCHGSAGRFSALADVLAFHGQQTACFSYNDRDGLLKTADQLVNALEQLEPHLQTPKMTVIGHSQGGLIARKALTHSAKQPVKTQTDIELVTISAPFAGIAAARFCGYPAVRIGTLGLNDLLCWAVSGEKWHQITFASQFIQKPGLLVPPVKRHLLISTDERNSCRAIDENGNCLKSDYVFSLREQILPKESPSSTSEHTAEAGAHLDNDGRLEPERLKINAGHVEIVGNHGIKPTKLIQALQDTGFIAPTHSAHRKDFEALLQRLYAQID